MTQLTHSKLQFRRLFYSLLRVYQSGVSLSNLEASHFDINDLEVFVQRGLVEVRDGLYFLTDAGLLMAQNIFPSQVAQLQNLKCTFNAFSDGNVFISDLQMHGNSVVTEYLSDMNGNVSEDIDDAIFCKLKDWPSKKEIIKTFDVKPVLRSTLLSSINDIEVDDKPRNVDYSEFFS